MTSLFLIRHGNTLDEETERVYKGTTNIPLSQAGVRRMERAAAFMSVFKLDKVYTSSLSRSMESGTIIAGAQGLDICVEPSFDEINFGLWEGLSFTEVRERYPQELNLWLKEPGRYPPPRGESFRAAKKRSMARLNQIVNEQGGHNIAIVVHAGILRIMILSILGCRLSGLFRIGQDYGCINIVDIYDDGNATLNLLNFTYY